MAWKHRFRTARGGVGPPKCFPAKVGLPIVTVDPPGSPFGPQARYLTLYGGNEIRPQGSFQRGPRHQGGQPAAENHHSGAKKVVSGSNGASSGSIMVSWWHPEKVRIFEILVDFHAIGTPWHPLAAGTSGGAVWRPGALFGAVWRKRNPAQRQLSTWSKASGGPPGGQKPPFGGQKSGFRVEWCLIGVHYGVLVAP